MLQTLREKTSGWIAFFILGAVTIPFAFFGINDYFSAANETFVAKVDDKEVTPDAYRQRLDRIRSNLRQQQGEAFDSAYLDQPTVKRQVLDQMIDEEVLALAAETSGTQISDARLRDEIGKVAAFHDAGGKFDPNLYRTLLTSQGTSVQQFENDMRRDLSMREIPLQVAQTSLVTDAQIERFVTLSKQTRDIRYALIPEQAATEEPTDEAIKAYYDGHQSEFMTEEKVALEYVELDAATMSADAEPTEDELRARYEEQKARYVQGEQRLASHILVKVAPNADAEAQKAAQAKAAELSAKARAGEDFAELAAESSDDIGSKSQGGDLGWLERGVTEPAFETALFALKAAGDVSEPVKTSEGYHVIRLRELKSEEVKPFDAVRDELEREFVEAARERVYTETSAKLIDEVLKNPEALAQAAKSQDVEVRTTALFGRTGGTETIAQNPRVLREAFSEGVLVEGAVSDPIELGPNHIAIIRVTEHQPSVPRPLAEVRDQVVAQLKSEAARARTEALAESLRQKIGSGATLDAVAQELGAEVQTGAGIGRQALNLDPALVAEAFKLARPTDKPVTAIVDLRPGAHAVVEVVKVVDGDPKAIDAAERERMRQQLLTAAQGTESRGLVDVLRDAADVRVAEDRL